MKYIKVLNANGEILEAEILLSFNMNDTGKSYILYTFGEKDDAGMETIHASSVVKNEKGYQLDAMSEDEWANVKEIMREIIRNKGE